MKTEITLAAAALLISLLTACAVHDADLENAGIVEFTLSPATSETNVFVVDVSANMLFGYSSPEDANLEILVDGRSVHQQSIATESLSAAIDATIPLQRQGTNEVIGILRYHGHEVTQRFTVSARMDEPALSFGAWTTNYVANVGMTAATSVTPTVAADYQIDDVSFSIDDGAWAPATDNGDGTWQLELTNPDIGDSSVAVRVAASYDSHSIASTTYDTLTVDAVFDCNTPTQSMQPTTELRQDMSVENRVMIGYFGHPNGGHDISFVATARDDNGVTFDAIGENVSRGYSAINAEFSVNRFRCNTNPCGQDYRLAVYVDGLLHCENINFGEVWEY